MNPENNEPTDIKPTSKKIALLLWLGSFSILAFYEVFLLVFKLLQKSPD
jgi:hypothetical protein